MTETPNELVADFIRARTLRDKAQVEFDDAQARLMKQMEADQRKSFRWGGEDAEHVLTFVQQHITEIDEPGLRKALTAKVFDKYTVRKLDRRAMERAMDDGSVDPVTVSRYVTQRPKKPFITYSEKEKN